MAQVNMNDYQGRSVLVTGADGFIGSHLCDALVERRANVTGIVRGSTLNGCGSWSLRSLEMSTASRMKLQGADVASPDIRNVIKEANPEIILHLAAIAHVDYSFNHPEEVFRVNAGGTQNILEAARQLPSLKRLVVISSSEIYGSRKRDKIDEEHPLKPTSPYAASKVAADMLAQSYHRTYGTPVVVLRPFNTYGPRHTYDVIPKFLRLALAGEPLTIYGDGQQDRDLTYVSDTVEGMLQAGIAKEIDGGVYNLGTGNTVSVNDIARAIKSLTKSSSEIVHVEKRAAEVSSLISDHEKATRAFGYQPRVSFEDGLQRNLDEMQRNSGE